MNTRLALIAGRWDEVAEQLIQEFRQQVERLKEAPKLPPIPDDDPE